LQLVRKNIQVTEEQSEALRKLAYETRVSESEHIRRAIEAYLNHGPRPKEE